MLFEPDKTEKLTLSRYDPTHALSAYSKHAFELEGLQWPSVEHYYQAMKFSDESYRERIRTATHPADATKLGKSMWHGRRKDWKKVRETFMTRAIYIKCRTHPEIAETLLATGEIPIIETSQYDYFWGCGRDQRGENAFGKVLMNVRTKLGEEAEK